MHGSGLRARKREVSARVWQRRPTGSRWGWGTRWVLVLVGGWVSYLLYSVLAWALNGLVPALLSIAFALLYLVGSVCAVRRRAPVWALTSLAGLVLLEVVAASVFGGVPGRLVFVSVAAAVSLPMRWAPPGVIFVGPLGALIAAVNGVAVDTAVFVVVQILMLGAAAIALRALVAAAEELRAARERVAGLAVERERLRFARDLHDLLGQTLSLIVVKSQLVAGVAADRGAVLREAADIEAIGQDALDQVRNVVAGYRSRSLSGELSAARQTLAAVGIELRCDDRRGGDLPSEAETALAFALREGVTNIVRHSGAHTCTLAIGMSDGCAWLELCDDGIGVQSDESPGHGLCALAERVEATGGHVEMAELAAGGLALRVRIPTRHGQTPSAADAQPGRTDGSAAPWAGVR